MKKVLVLLPKEGFEEVEAITPVDYLRRAGAEVVMASMGEDLLVTGAHGITIKADAMFDTIDVAMFDAVVLPGGLPGAHLLRDDQRVMDLLLDYAEKDKLISAICAAPVALNRAGLIASNTMYTCYPGIESGIDTGVYTGEKATKSDNIITGKGPSAAIDFTLEIIEYLFDKEKRKALEEDLLYT